MKSEKGQTMVEYMLLLAVSISLVITFINSDFFKKYFGSNGEIGKMIKGQYEFAYRHAFIINRPPTDVPRDIGDATQHPSYYQPSGETRFFGPKIPYPSP